MIPFGKHDQRKGCAFNATSNVTVVLSAGSMILIDPLEAICDVVLLYFKIYNIIMNKSISFFTTPYKP